MFITPIINTPYVLEENLFALQEAHQIDDKILSCLLSNCKLARPRPPRFNCEI